MFNRIINNDAYGLTDASLDYTNMEDYNYIYGNATAARNNWAAGSNSETTDGDDGCEDAVNNDYNVKNGAVLRSEAINLNWET